MKRKLKWYVLPALYLIVLGVMAFGITVLSRNLLKKESTTDDHYNYTMSVFGETEDKQTESTNNESTETKIQKPFTSEKVTVAKEFYDKNDTAENQTKALIFYENTYMPNTGILYESEEEFDCLAILDGTIKDIKKDEILGNVITVEHQGNITSIYYTHGETSKNVGDTVKMGETVAKSGESKLETEKPQTLLFEVYMNGTLVNPNTIFEKNISELN